MGETEIKFRSDNTVQFVDMMGDDARVARAAWVSYGRDKREAEPGRVEGLINFLMREKHMTPFEQVTFTFRIETPIFVAREFFRHRSASYNEMSGRYTVMPYDFYLPNSDRPLVQTGKAGDYTFTEGNYQQYALVDGVFRRVIGEAVNAYECMLSAGVAKEVARDILPLGTYTHFYVSMNARNLMHFLNLRTESQALYEIREVAGQMEAIFEQELPLTAKAWKNGRS